MIDLSSIPEPVRARADSLGDIGTDWLTSLPEQIDSLQREWQCRIESTALAGGTEAVLLRCSTSDAEQAVLKLGLPGSSDIIKESTVLKLAAGRGYAKVYAVDKAANAMMIERLGAPLTSFNFASTVEMDVICATLRDAAVPMTSNPGLTTGAEKAQWLSDFIEEMTTTYPDACHGDTIAQARDYIVQRIAAHDPKRCTLVHGDAHALNTLSTLEGYGRTLPECKFIDPDGLYAEPEYDLAIPMREYTSELIEGNTAELGLARCQRLAARTKLDADAIWQWGYIECISTGFTCLHHLQWQELGHEMLSVANAWQGHEPG
ncbi:MAG: aminoglycoside phosphotransferase family protein [Pseudomonadota bacterium]